MAARHLVPPWAPTYDMRLSSAAMPCNYSGFFDVPTAAQWGLADFDWSNAKLVWVNDKPMDCEALLARQAEAVKAASPSTRIFVYRNLVKALPWFGSVREKLEDPAYSGWFLHYRTSGGANFSSPECTGRKCSRLFHDQDQTPSTDIAADGRCFEECDCGRSLPCGEYLWDHRNSSLRQWLLEEYVFGPSALGHGGIDGLFLDDEWYDSPLPNPSWGPPEGFCTASPYGGPSEVHPGCVADMGLSHADVRAITAGWQQTLSQVHAAALEAGRWIYQLFRTVGAPPRAAEECAAYFRDACRADSQAQLSATLFSFSGAQSRPLPSPTDDVAAFLLTRGPYGWIGFGWVGCVSCNLTAEDPRGLCDPAGTYERPSELDADYGEPRELCAETSTSSRVFAREWSKAHVSFDCNSWKGTIESRLPLSSQR